MKFNRNVISIVLTALGVTLPLAFFGFRPIYLADLTVQSNSETRAQIHSKSVSTRIDGGGVGYFDFRAAVSTANGHVLFLEVRPAAEPKFVRQGDGYRVVGGVAAGVLQLGSKRWPLHEDEQYTFRLVDTSGEVFVDGKIIAKVYAIAGSSQLAILSIGLFASILQVLVFIWPLGRAN